MLYIEETVFCQFDSCFSGLFYIYVCTRIQMYIHVYTWYSYLVHFSPLSPAVGNGIIYVPSITYLILKLFASGARELGETHGYVRIENRYTCMLRKITCLRTPALDFRAHVLYHLYHLYLCAYERPFGDQQSVTRMIVQP